MIARNFLEKIYPLLFTIYPIFSLYSTNLSYVTFGDTFRVTIFALLGLLLGWLLIKWLTQSWMKANALITLLVVLFFSYGHLYLIALNRFETGFSHRNLLLAYALLGTLGTWLIIFRLDERFPLSRFLGVVGAVLVATSLFQIAWYQFQVLSWSNGDETVKLQSGEEIENLPDMYLIILDAHTRSDVLQRDYGLDNSDFIASLEKMGFFVAECSQSNYPITDLALQSLFNMDYVHEFIGEGDILPGLKTSVAKRTFNETGYTTISFHNYFSSHYDLGEDLLIKRPASITERVNLFTGLSEFEALVVETSALRLMVDFQHLLSKYFGELFSDEEKYYSHYLETLFILEELKKLPGQPQTKFVFAHIAVPHWPFVFSEEGEYEHIWGLPASEGYRKNVIFIDQQIIGVLADIIEKSENPPVIILMGDHGPTGEGVRIESRMSNLYAMFADNKIQEKLYSRMTPVNSFRFVFNHYFGTEYSQLDDISYRIWNNDTYELDKIIPNTCPK